MPKLEAVTLAKLKPKDKDYTLPDGDGLSLLIKTDGTKLWEFRYTSPTHLKRRKSSLGTYPNVPLKNAREKAKEYRELIANGIDVIDNNKEAKQKIKANESGKFETVVYEWFSKQEQELALATYKRKLGQFENDVIPFFRGRLISTIKHPEIVKILEMKSIKAPESANRLFTYLSNYGSTLL